MVHAPRSGPSGAALPLFLRAHNAPVPEWVRAANAAILDVGLLDAEDAAVRLDRYDCALLDASQPAFLASARRVHQLDANLQIIAVTTPDRLAATRQSLLYAAGLGEVWVASPTEVSAAIAERAAGVTRQRRRFQRTRARIESIDRTASPQRTERALISDAYLAGLLRVLPDPVFSVDATGRILSANRAAESMFMRAGSTLIGERLIEALGILGDFDDVDLLRRASGEQPLTVSFALGAGRSVRLGELRASPMEESGEAAWAVVLRDLTREQATYRALANAIPTLAWTARADGFIDWYNQQWYAYTGTTPAEMEGWGWQSVHDPQVLPDVMERWRASIKTGQPFEMTFPLRGADGVYRAFLTRVVPLRDENGRVVRWFGTNTDVEAERTNRIRIERLQSLTEALAATQTLEAVATVVATRAVEAASADASIIALLEPGSREARTLQLVGLPAELRERFRTITLDDATPLADAMREGEPIFLESRSGPDGLLTRYPQLATVVEDLAVHAVAALPLLAAGAVVGGMSFLFRQPRTFVAEERNFFVSFARQSAQAIERARLFEAERAARERADEANRAKSQFLATMSHELRTPLNAISGHVNLVLEGIYGPVSDQQRRALERVLLAQDHLLGLINDVLSFARIEGGRLEYRIQPTDVCEVIRSVQPLVEPQMLGKGIRFEVDLAGFATGYLVMADADKLAQVLINLLSNAMKFTDPGGYVGITLETTTTGNNAPAAAIKVRDTGVGIPADKLEAIFDPFVQVRAELTRTRDGTGLGLAISRDLARGMGGDLLVESELGKGSTFTILVPPVRPEPVADQTPGRDRGARAVPGIEPAGSEIR